MTNLETITGKVFTKKFNANRAAMNAGLRAEDFAVTCVGDKQFLVSLVAPSKGVAITEHVETSLSSHVELCRDTEGAVIDHILDIAEENLDRIGNDLAEIRAEVDELARMDEGFNDVMAGVAKRIDDEIADAPSQLPNKRRAALKLIENVAPVEPIVEKAKPAPTVRAGSVGATLVALAQRPGGATIAELRAAGAKDPATQLRDTAKRLGLRCTVERAKPADQTRYTLTANIAAKA